VPWYGSKPSPGSADPGGGSRAGHYPAGVHILLVDPQIERRGALAGLLASLGHATAESGDGGEAVQLVREHRPDLVVADLASPGMEGLDLLIALRALPGRPPVALVVGDGDVAAAVVAMRHGAVACLGRSQVADQLRHLVSEALPTIELPDLPRLPPGRLHLDPTGCDLDAWQRALVVAALQFNRGSPVKASAFLGISRKVLYTLRKRYGLFEPDDKDEE
jgi:DNA-binding NtrC family response regulator